MTKSLLKVLAAGTVLIGLGASLALAAADDQIKARQAHMKANGKMMGTLSKIVKGETSYDAAAVKALTDEVAAAAKASEEANGWGADSQKGETVETYAKPEVWSDADGFAAAYKKYADAFTAVSASTDEASFKAAFPALGQSCQGCHETYRRPKD